MAKTAVKAKKDLRKPQHPPQRKTTDARASRSLLWLVGAAGLIALIGIGLVLTRGSGDGLSGAGAASLPHTSDYHSLLVAPNAPDQGRGWNRSRAARKRNSKQPR